MGLYPVTLDLCGRRCLVIGGGRVAWRKVRGVCEAGADVLVISPEVVPELAELAKTGRIEWRARDFQPGDLAGAGLVFAATNSPAVQEEVWQEARALGILLNMADEPGKSSFHVPGHFRRGDILVTVSTGGQSPAMTSMLRQLLKRQLAPEYAQVVSFFALLRRKICACDDDAEAHGQLFAELLGSGMVERILEGAWQDVVRELDRLLPRRLDGDKLVREFLEKE